MTINRCGNVTCSGTLPIPSRPHGRRMLYCSVECRRAAEYATRRKTRTFGGIKAGFLAEGEDTIRQRLADDPDFADELRELAESYLKPPDGRAETDIDPEVLELLFTQDRRFSVIGHDNPLPGSGDIDRAEQSGDWTPMVKDALHSMGWQLVNGFKPDLREFE